MSYTTSNSAFLLTVYEIELKKDRAMSIEVMIYATGFALRVKKSYIKYPSGRSRTHLAVSTE